MADTAEKEAPDCRCDVPKPDGRGTCSTCGRFACEYADRGRTRCSPCDCFIGTFPESPRALHPEAFLVNGHQYQLDGSHTDDCPGCA